MRFLIVGLNYLPESASIGPYTADLAEYLLDCGHQVKVITGFPMAPQWRIWDGYQGKYFMRETINDVPIFRTYLYVPKEPRKTLSRIMFDMSFVASATLGILMSGPCDLVIVISPPLQLGITGWLASIIKRVPLFLHIKDIVPDVAVGTGMVSEDSNVIKVAQALERFVYSHATGIGVICEGFSSNLLAKGVLSSKIAIIPDYINLDFMRLCKQNNYFREKHNIDSQDFVVMYSGSIALKQALQTFVESAALLKEYDKILFYLIGEGLYLKQLKDLTKRLMLTNLHFLPLQPREGLPQQLAAADALVIAHKRAVRDTVFPGKLIYYMAAGRPILAAVSSDSEIGRFISKNQVGIVIPPEEPQALAQAIQFLRQNPQEANRLGRNGRKVIEEQFDRRIVLKRFAEYLEALVRNY